MVTRWLILRQSANERRDHRLPAYFRIESDERCKLARTIDSHSRGDGKRVFRPDVACGGQACARGYPERSVSTCRMTDYRDAAEADWMGLGENAKVIGCSGPILERARPASAFVADLPYSMFQVAYPIAVKALARAAVFLLVAKPFVQQPP